MTSFISRFGRTQLAILLAVSAGACKLDSATESAPPDDGTLKLEAITPTDLSGTVGEQVDLVPSVVVRDAKGRGVPGMRVSFTPLSTSESVAGDNVTNRIVTTDSRGIATPGNWKLGTMAGWHDLEASILDEHYWSPEAMTHRLVIFRAEAKAAAPAALRKDIFVDSLGLAGDNLQPLRVVVVDRFGNGVPGVTVAFSVLTGGGRLEITNGVSSRFGFAASGAWMLGPQPGLNSVIASVPGLNSLTFDARALDVGAVTWYDLVPQSVRLIVKASIALGEDGTFELLTLEASDAFPGEFPGKQLGKYTVAGTAIVLTFANAAPEQGTLDDHSLSFVHKMQNWNGYPLENWTFVKRPATAGPQGVPLFISGVMGPLHQGVRVAQIGPPVTDAEVTVNGVRIPHCCGDLYSGDLPEAVAAGGTLNLKVVGGGMTYEATGEVIATPVITAPVAGSTFSSAEHVGLTWSTPTDPDRFEVCLNCFENSIDGESWYVGGNEREFSTRPGSLTDWGHGTIVAVKAYKSNFLKTTTSADEGISDVLFLARSADVLVNIK